MSYSDYRITLDVRKTVASVQINAKKGDTGRRIYITLSDNGSPFQIGDGCYAVFSGKKPDGTVLYNKTTIDGNTIIYDFTPQTTAVAGLVACEVKLFGSMSNLLTSPKLTILVDDVVVDDEEIASIDEITALTELVVEATAITDLIDQAAKNANAATQNANLAASTANQAAGNANDAAGNAGDEAANANQAAEEANKAAGSANQAAATANKAAASAETATEETIVAKEAFLEEAREAIQSLSDTAAEYAPAIVCESSGEVITVSNAADRPLQGLTIYGKTVQADVVTPDSPAELVSLGPMGTTTTTVNSQGELVIAMRQLGSLNIDRYFDAYGGKVAYEMDYALELCGCLEVDPNVFGVRGIDRAGAVATVLNVKVYVSKDGLTFGTYDAGGENPISTICEEGKTYRVKAVLDSDTDTYDLYIDGQQVIKGRGLRCDAAAFNGIRLIVHRSGGRTAPKLYCGNIAVTGQYAPVFAEDFSNGLGKWSVGTAAAVNSAGQLELKRSAGYTSSVGCDLKESFSGDKKTAIAFDLKLNGDLSTNFEAGLLLRNSQTGKTAVNVGVVKGSLMAQYGSTKGVVGLGRLHRIKVVTDPQTSSIDVYLDGALVAGGVAYTNGQTTWDTLRVFAKGNDGTKPLSACFDNLEVSQAEEASQSVYLSEDFSDAALAQWTGGMRDVKEGTVTATVCGKNLLEKTSPKNVTWNGVTIITNDDGGVTVNGTPTRSMYHAIGNILLKAGQSYILSGCPSGGGVQSYRLDLRKSYTELYEPHVFDFGSGVTFTPTEDVNVICCIRIDGTVSNLTFYPMIRLASVKDSTYERYKGQTLTVSTPNGLPGIPLGAPIPDAVKNSPAHMAGVWYCEEEAQYYLSDYKDYARGVYVQLTVLLENFSLMELLNETNRYAVQYDGKLYGGENAVTMCTVMGPAYRQFHNADAVHYYVNAAGNKCHVYVPKGFDNSGNAIQVLAALETPIETAMSAEEMAAYGALHSNKPNTTAFNDAFAGMKLGYTADTKLYIDQKLAAISAALLNT